MKYLALMKAGQYRECEPGETASAVLLKNYEYANLQGPDLLDIEIRANRLSAGEANREKKKIKAETETADAQIEALEAELENRCAAMRELDDKVSQAHASNENLIRMVKEKANQDRGLRPKKGHHGYRVIRLDEETTKIGYDGNDNPIDLRGWRTTLETPYDIDIPVELIEETVKDDLSQALRGSVGIFKGRYTDVPEILCERNVVYNYDFHANIYDKNHLWTVCLHSPHQVEIEDGKEDE